MALLVGTNVLDKVVPFDSNEQFATHEDKYGQGGLHTDVLDITERDNIPAERRKEGMLVYVKTPTPTMYQLVGGITNSDWEVFNTGGGGGGSFDGNLSGVLKATGLLQTLTNAGFTYLGNQLGNLPVGHGLQVGDLVSFESGGAAFAVGRLNDINGAVVFTQLSIADVGESPGIIAVVPAAEGNTVSYPAQIYIEGGPLDGYTFTATALILNDPSIAGFGLVDILATTGWSSAPTLPVWNATPASTVPPWVDGSPAPSQIVDAVVETVNANSVDLLTDVSSAVSEPLVTNVSIKRKHYFTAGALGVNTQNPQAALHVAGDIKAEKLLLSGTSLADSQFGFNGLAKKFEVVGLEPITKGRVAWHDGTAVCKRAFVDITSPASLSTLIPDFFSLQAISTFNGSILIAYLTAANALHLATFRLANEVLTQDGTTQVLIADVSAVSNTGGVAMRLPTGPFDDVVIAYKDLAGFPNVSYMVGTFSGNSATMYGPYLTNMTGTPVNCAAIYGKVLIEDSGNGIWAFDTYGASGTNYPSLYYLGRGFILNTTTNEVFSDLTQSRKVLEATYNYSWGQLDAIPVNSESMQTQGNNYFAHLSEGQNFSLSGVFMVDLPFTVSAKTKSAFHDTPQSPKGVILQDRYYVCGSTSGGVYIYDVLEKRDVYCVKNFQQVYSPTAEIEGDVVGIDSVNGRTVMVVNANNEFTLRRFFFNLCLVAATAQVGDQVDCYLEGQVTINGLPAILSPGAEYFLAYSMSSSPEDHGAIVARYNNFNQGLATPTKIGRAIDAQTLWFKPEFLKAPILPALYSGTAGPAGPQGDPGPAGPQGDPGPAGAADTASGSGTFSTGLVSGGTPPAGTLAGTYSWYRLGELVFLTAQGSWDTPGVNNTYLRLDVTEFSSAIPSAPPGGLGGIFALHDGSSIIGATGVNDSDAFGNYVSASFPASNLQFFRFKSVYQ